MAVFDLVVIGDTNLDLLVKVKRFPSEDDEVEAQEVRYLPGGDAANTASQAALLGLRTGLISCVADDDHAKLLMKSLQSRGVDTSAVQIAGSKNTGMVIVTVREDGQRTMIASRGANTDLTLGEAQRTLLNAARVVHICDPLPQVLKALPGLVDARQTTVSLDPGSISASMGVDDLASVLRLCRYVFLNQNELHLLTRLLNPAESAQKVLAYGPEVLFLKCGADGCRIYTKSKQVSLPGFAVQSVDATGAGDAFDAAMIYALLQGMPLAGAGRFANAAGALTTLGLGAQTSQPDLSRINEFLHGR